MQFSKKIDDLLVGEKGAFQNFYNNAFEQLVELGLTFHFPEMPYISAKHPFNKKNGFELWIKGRKGNRKLVGKLRVDNCDIKQFSTGMRDKIDIHKYDRIGKPVWLQMEIKDNSDLDKYIVLVKNLLSQKPKWGKNNNG